MYADIIINPEVYAELAAAGIKPGDPFLVCLVSACEQLVSGTLALKSLYGHVDWYYAKACDQVLVVTIKRDQVLVLDAVTFS